MHALKSPIVRTAIAGLALVAGATAVSAQTFEPRSTVVSYSDLDLSSPSGVERLNSRIHYAAKRVCAVDSSIAPAKASVLRGNCMRTALADADKSVRLAVSTQSNHRYASRDSGKGIMVGTR